MGSSSTTRTVRLARVIYVCVLYSPPRSPYKDDLNNHIIATVDNIRSSAEESCLFILGDFNDLDTALLEQHTLLSQVVSQTTRGSATLDKILTDLATDYHDPVISAPVSTSDHSVITYHPRNAIAPKKSLRTIIRPFWESSIRTFGQ